jgi:hypothetical protein
MFKTLFVEERQMKKVLVILAVLAMTGISSAAMLNNPEGFDSYASGTVLWTGSAPVDGWEGWGAASGGSAGWQGGNDRGTVFGSSGSQYVSVTAAGVVGGNDWGYGLLFNHGNAIGDLPAPAVAGTAEISFDLLSIAGNAIVKIEYWGDLARTISFGADVWDPITLAPGSHTFVGTVPVGTAFITPVIGITNGGAGAVAIYDNLGLAASIPEPATMALLGLGGLFLRRRKK